MNKIILILIFQLWSNISFSQNKEEAEKRIKEGVILHDKGNYDAAIVKYNKALELDKDNLEALTEKAFSLYNQQKFSESINCCKKAIEKHPGDSGLKLVYVTYGSATDGMNKTEKSLEIYDEGIKMFPTYYPLYFNKGVTLAGDKEYDEALLCFQKAIILNPEHASSHNAIARISSVNNKNIPSLLAYCRFLVIEPKTNRSVVNFTSMQKIMSGNVKNTGKNSITIYMNPDMFGDTLPNGKPKANSFKTIDLLLSMTAALDFDKKNKKKKEVEKFQRKFETVCAGLKESQKDNYGFFWEYYAPYYIEMYDKKFLETFCYIAFSSTDEAYVSKWLKSHKSEVAKFYEWSNSFEWKTN